MKQKDIDRFWSYVKKSNGCWEWQGGINSTGRGIFWLNSKTPKAHRISWEIHNGPVEGDFLVLHHCDNGKCVNPNHLYLGTFKDNSNDRLKRNRANLPRGTEHWNFKNGKYSQYV